MHPVHFPNDLASYVLATGEAAAYRLRILHGLYGPGTRRVLLESGLRVGMRVADLGCGVGMVTETLAELDGPNGQIVGMDQPVVVRGEHKRLLELSVAEAGPAFVDAGLITSWHLNRILFEMRRLAGDGTVLAVMPRMAQVWARKPALPERGATSG